MAHIGINAHLLSGAAGYRRAGIHHYIAQTLQHLGGAASAHKYTVFTQYDAPFLHQPPFTAVSTHWPTTNPSARIAWEQTAWPAHLWRQQCELLHSMAFVTPLWAPCPAVITVYDLSFLHFPERFPPLQRWYLTSQTRRSCRAARRVITISQATRQDVHHYFQVPLERITVAYPGVDAHYQVLSPTAVSEFRQAQGIGRFLLHVGTLQPRKNIPLLLEALALLPDKSLHLVLVGGKGWLYDEIFARITALDLTQRVHFAGYVPDELLPLWYNAAELLIFPSVYEGFGFPVVEAMACGTPVLAANTSSLPEAVGDAGQLFDPQNAQELANQITAVLQDTAVVHTMRSKGLAQASQFTWEQTGQQTINAYEQALK
jgi:glycosyltransferase involved in cell wall biosynthesis